VTAGLTAARQPFIDGKFVSGAQALGVENPATELVFAEVEAASPAQFEQAVHAARRAFDDGPWPAMTTGERLELLGDLAGALAARRDALVESCIAETGTPRALAQAAQVDLSLAQARQLTELFGRLPEWEHNELPLDGYLQPGGRQLLLSIRRYEPVGVVAAITPYNFPLQTAVWKVFQSLAVGCTVVLRPSPLTPLQNLAFGEAAEQVGLPPGVLNVLAEPGADGAALLTSHPGVDAVTFTGSTAVGRAVSVQAAATVKRLTLELGGKSAQIYTDDALHLVAAGAVRLWLSHSGQACSGKTRMLVPAASVDTAAAAVAAAAARLAVGDPQSAATQLGPVISAAQRERCERYVAEGLAAGGELVCGGSRPVGLDRGYCFAPTALVVPDNANPAARDEIFGPVITIQGYRDIDEAVAIANDSELGLSAAVHTGDLRLGLSIANRLRTGTVEVNTGSPTAYTPMGGYKQSGVGRERGVAGFREYQELKHIAVGPLGP
jgi:acyl-CoA reductase-like NAD-dependent aldehyde dehydrogenase